MNAVIAVPKHYAQARLFNTHVAVGALGILLHLRLVFLSFLLIRYLLVTASEEFGKRDSVPSVFKRQQQLIILWLNFTSL
jgi:hypothetical protein